MEARDPRWVAAGFLLALADGLPLEECLRRGCAAVLQP